MGGKHNFHVLLRVIMAMQHVNKISVVSPFLMITPLQAGCQHFAGHHNAPVKSPVPDGIGIMVHAVVKYAIMNGKESNQPASFTWGKWEQIIAVILLVLMLLQVAGIVWCINEEMPDSSVAMFDKA